MSFGPYITDKIEKITEKQWPHDSTSFFNNIMIRLDRRLEIRWKTKRNKVYPFHLKVYGAEWVERDWFSELDGILAPYIDHYVDPVETIRQIRDPPEYPDND